MVVWKNLQFRNSSYWLFFVSLWQRFKRWRCYDLCVYSIIISFNFITLVHWSDCSWNHDITQVCFLLCLCSSYMLCKCSDAYVHTTFWTLEALAQEHQNLIILGDLNSPDICWSSLNGSTPFSVALCDLVLKYNLEQLIDTPTQTQGNILDILMTNRENLIQNIVVKKEFPHLFSDHFFITFHTIVASNPSKQSKTRYFLNYNKTDFDSLNEYLLDIDFDTCFTSPSIDIAWHNLKRTILSAAALFTPKTKVNSRLHPKWFNSEIKHSLHIIHSLRRKVRSN